MPAVPRARPATLALPAQGRNVQPDATLTLGRACALNVLRAPSRPLPRALAALLALPATSALALKPLRPHPVLWAGTRAPGTPPACPAPPASPASIPLTRPPPALPATIHPREGRAACPALPARPARIPRGFPLTAPAEATRLPLPPRVHPVPSATPAPRWPSRPFPALTDTMRRARARRRASSVLPATSVRTPP